jgi:hypothetical protein
MVPIRQTSLQTISRLTSVNPRLSIRSVRSVEVLPWQRDRRTAPLFRFNRAGTT